MVKDFLLFSPKKIKSCLKLFTKLLLPKKIFSI